MHHLKYGGNETVLTMKMYVTFKKDLIDWLKFFNSRIPLSEHSNCILSISSLSLFFVFLSRLSLYSGYICFILVKMAFRDFTVCWLKFKMLCWDRYDLQQLFGIRRPCYTAKDQMLLTQFRPCAPVALSAQSISSLTLHWPYITNALFCRVKTLVEHVAIWIFTPVCLLLGWMYQTLMACLDCVCVRETLVLRSQLGPPGFAVYGA